MKTTNKQFQQFKKECQKWIKFWGLTEWDVYFEHVDLSEPCYAICHSDMIGMIATFSFNKNLEEGLEDNPKETAFHEICELLLAKLDVLAKCRFTSKEEVETAKHEIVRRIENCFYKREHA